MSDEPRRPEPTFDELDVDVLVPDDRHLTLRFSGEKRRLPVPGDLGVLTMARLLKLERQLNSGTDEDGEIDGEKLTEALMSANEAIIEIVRVRTPDAPEHDELGVGQMTATLAWLAGDATVAHAVARGITVGRDIPEPPGAVATAGTTVPDETVDAQGEDPGPFVSSELSSSVSSGSGVSTDGPPSGGETVPGGLSERTSLTPTSV